MLHKSCLGSVYDVMLDLILDCEDVIDRFLCSTGLRDQGAAS